jgi:hypothetical protein
MNFTLGINKSLHKRDKKSDIVVKIITKRYTVYQIEIEI